MLCSPGCAMHAMHVSRRSPAGCCAQSEHHVGRYMGSLWEHGLPVGLTTPNGGPIGDLHLTGEDLAMHAMHARFLSASRPRRAHSLRRRRDMNFRGLRTPPHAMPLPACGAPHLQSETHCSPALLVHAMHSSTLHSPSASAATAHSQYSRRRMHASTHARGTAELL